MNVFSLPRTEEDAIKLFQAKGILPKMRHCDQGHEMTLNVGGTHVRWRCNKRECRSDVSMRVGNWMAGIRLSYVTLLRFIYGWAWQYTSIDWCERELGINHNTTVSMNAIMRETCALYMMGQPNQKIGGHGHIVEVDESLFSRRKSNCGRIFCEQWVVGGICRDTKDCFLVCVANRTATTLVKVISDHVLDGTTIYTDCWKGYSSVELRSAGYDHMTVNHRYNFVDPFTGVHTQNIERLWGAAKWRNKVHRGTKRDFLDSYFIEFMARRKSDDDTFEWILRVISETFPPECEPDLSTNSTTYLCP